MLLGVNLGSFEVLGAWNGEFSIQMRLKNKCDGFQWVLMAVYGAAQPEHKDRFLTECVNTVSYESLPILVGGDFNIIRYPSVKSNDRFKRRWPNLFIACIDSLNLRELELSGRKTQTFEKLDRALVSPDWEQKIPLTSVQALTREIFGPYSSFASH
jgi:hypothetical protein